MNRSIQLSLLLMAVLALLLAACSDSGTAGTSDEPAATTPPVEEATATPEPTAPPTATPRPTATPEPAPTVEATAGEPGSDPASSEFVLGEVVSYQVESSGLTFDYPAGWVITEDPAFGVRIESEEGFGARFTRDGGSMVVILPMAAADLIGQNPIEKLASFILDNGVPDSAELADPVTLIVNGQELAYSAFVDPGSGLEGIFAAYFAGDEVAAIFAVASGDDRTAYRPAVETIVNSIVLPAAE